MKNKKLLILLCIPLIISVMVLPLCSFTTTLTDPTDYSIYESSTQCDLSYRYHRSNYGFYNGTIPSANRILIDPTQTTIAGIRDSVKFEACDLFMGNSTKSIDIRSFSVSSLPSRLTRNSNDDLFLGICYRSDDYLYSQLDGIFRFWNFTFSDDIYIEPYDVNYNSYSPYTAEWSNFVGWVTVDVAQFNSDTYSFEYDSYHLVGTLEDMYNYYSPSVTSDTVVFDLNCIVQTVLDTYSDLLNENLGKTYFITNVELCLDYVPTDGSAFLGYGAVRLNSLVTEKTSDGLSYDHLGLVLGNIGDLSYSEGFSAGEASGYSSGYDAGYSEGFNSAGSSYNEGYNDGYNVGLSNADSVWKSFSTFLTTTIGGFLDMRITPTITISSMLGIILSVTLVVAFLKIFAGG